MAAGIEEKIPMPTEFIVWGNFGESPDPFAAGYWV
jgi:hypothetical protein